MIHSCSLCAYVSCTVYPILQSQEPGVSQCLVHFFLIKARDDSVYQKVAYYDFATHTVLYIHTFNTAVGQRFDSSNSQNIPQTYCLLVVCIL